jgi:hypothetical protein
MDNHSRHSADDSEKACKYPCLDHQARHVFQQPKSRSGNNSAQTGTHPVAAVVPASDIVSPV